MRASTGMKNDTHYKAVKTLSRDMKVALIRILYSELQILKIEDDNKNLFDLSILSIVKRYYLGKSDHLSEEYSSYTKLFFDIINKNIDSITDDMISSAIGEYKKKNLSVEEEKRQAYNQNNMPPLWNRGGSLKALDNRKLIKMKESVKDDVECNYKYMSYQRASTMKYQETSFVLTDEGSIVAASLISLPRNNLDTYFSRKGEII